MRIALIHALRHSPPPVEAAFARLWPEATLMNLLDDSLSADLAREGALTRPGPWGLPWGPPWGAAPGAA